MLKRVGIVALLGVLCMGALTPVPPPPVYTTSNLDLYLKTSGGDRNDCSSSYPCLTVGGAKTRIPHIVRHVVTIHDLSSTLTSADFSGFLLDNSLGTTPTVKLVNAAGTAIATLNPSATQPVSATSGPMIIVRFATTANLNLSTTGLTAIDGITPVAGDLALVKNQSTASQNGIYVVGATAWARLYDSYGATIVQPAMISSVKLGTAGAGTAWVLASNGTTWNQLTVSGVSAVNLASTANGLGASLVGVEDALAILTATTVEGVTAELAKYEAINLADPGTGVAIPVTRSATVEMTVGSSGAETNTLAIPVFLGQRMVIVADVVGTGTRAITCAQALNVAGNTIMTFNAARDMVVLTAIKVGGAFRWEITYNASVSLS